MGGGVCDARYWVRDGIYFLCIWNSIFIRVRYSSPTTRRPVFTYHQDSMANKLDYVELGLECAEICRALDRGMNGKKLDELSLSVCDAINQLTT